MIKYVNILVSLFIFIFSLLILPEYTNGDQAVYINVYELMQEDDLYEAFHLYNINVSSQEYIHFILSWLLSGYISKDIFIAFSNSYLAYISMKLLRSWGGSATISTIIITTNFYMYVLYFSAERLKFGLIFIILSILYNKNGKKSFFFGILALLSHIQTLVVYISILLNYFFSLLSNEKIIIILAKSIVVIPIIMTTILLLSVQIDTKFEAYQSNGGVIGLYKVIIYLILSLIYSKNKISTLLIFLPLVLAIYFIGGERLNMFGYFIFLYYTLQYKNGINLSIIITTFYFLISSLEYIINIYNYGTGFPF